MTLKTIVQDIIPPFIWSVFGSLKQILPLLSARCDNLNAIRFEGDYATWEEASALCTGYDDTAILDNVLKATLKVKRGEAAYERDSVLFDKIEYAWPVLAGLLWAASRNGGRLNVLDFGGSLGSSFFQNRNFLQSLLDIRWNVVEQQHYVEAGRANIQDEQLRFYQNIDECLRENRPNVVLLSSVLQYLTDPEEIINKIVMVMADVIILDRTIINHAEAHRIYVQHVPASIYPASYPCRSLSESLLIKTMVAYQKKVDFKSLAFPVLRSIESEFKGYIFERIVT